jgi:hypothetical protein
MSSRREEGEGRREEYAGVISVAANVKGRGRRSGVGGRTRDARHAARGTHHASLSTQHSERSPEVRDGGRFRSLTVAARIRSSAFRGLRVSTTRCSLLAGRRVGTTAQGGERAPAATGGRDSYPPPSSLLPRHAARGTPRGAASGRPRPQRAATPGAVVQLLVARCSRGARWRQHPGAASGRPRPQRAATPGAVVQLLVARRAPGGDNNPGRRAGASGHRGPRLLSSSLLPPSRADTGHPLAVHSPRARARRSLRRGSHQ